MRSRLLMSAAIVVAGVAVASTQIAAQGASQDHRRDRHQAGNLDRSGLRNNTDNGGNHDRDPNAALGLEYLSLGDPGAGDRGTHRHRHALAARRRGLPDQGMGSADDRDLGHGRSQSRKHADSQLRKHANSTTRKQAHGQSHAQARRQIHNQNDHNQNQAGQTNAPDDQAHGAAVPPPPDMHSDLHQGGSDDIRQAQAALNQQGFHVGNPDGKLGRRTKVALIAFQKKHGLPKTGKVDRATLDALMAGNGTTPPVSGPGNNQPPAPAQMAPGQPLPGGQLLPGQTTLPGQLMPPPGAPDSTTTGQGAPSTTAPLTVPPTSQPLPEPPAAPPDGMTMPEGGGTGRVPSGSPQDEEIPPDRDQR